ncbi:MAG: radical SAM protein [Lachnospiraceae bacterium]|nr:radical SAM protein [Lachnospiraceae bacterium]
MRAALYGKGALMRKTYEYLERSGVENLGVLEDRVEDVTLSEAYPGARRADGNGMDAEDAVILVAENAWLSYAVKRLCAAGVRRICYLPYYYEEEGYEISDDSFVWIDPTLPRLEYIEYHVAWNCNLKCKGCTHFSNILEKEIFGDFDQFCKDLQRLQELFWGIYKIRLMGGEPLLNPQLAHFVAAARSAFPDADIRVVSNGLLLRDDMEDVLDTMAACDAGFDVSMYPPTKHMIGHMDEICKKHGVKLFVTPEVNEFRAFLDFEGGQKSEEVYPACPARHCAFLGAGVISTCSMPQLVPILNGHFGSDIPVEPEDIIDLYEEGLDGEGLLKRLHRPMAFCRYCTKEQRSFPWEPAGPDKAKLADWSVSGV